MLHVKFSRLWPLVTPLLKTLASSSPQVRSRPRGTAPVAPRGTAPVPPRGTAPSAELPVGLDGHGAVLGRGGGVAMHDVAGYAVLLAIFLAAVMVVVRGYYAERRECKA